MLASPSSLVRVVAVADGAPVRAATARRRRLARWAIALTVCAGIVSIGPVAAQLPNLLPNPEFDDDLAEWLYLGLEGSFVWSPLDWAGCGGSSGSGLLTNTGDISDHIEGALACANDIAPGVVHSYGASIRFSTGQATSGTATIQGFWIAAPGCAGLIVGQEFEETIASFPEGQWVQIKSDAVLPPPGAQSFSLNVRLTKSNAGGSLAIRIDGAHFVARQGYLFADGFEIGSFCRWS